jgi:hypothetical protein
MLKKIRTENATTATASIIGSALVVVAFSRIVIAVFVL